MSEDKDTMTVRIKTFPDDLTKCIAINERRFTPGEEYEVSKGEFTTLFHMNVLA